MKKELKLRQWLLLGNVIPGCGWIILAILNLIPESITTSIIRILLLAFSSIAMSISFKKHENIDEMAREHMNEATSLAFTCLLILVALFSINLMIFKDMPVNFVLSALLGTGLLIRGTKFIILERSPEDNA